MHLSPCLLHCLPSEPAGASEARKSANKSQLHRTFPFVEERQTFADFPKLSHPAVQLAQVLGVNLREVHKGGFFLELALPLELKQLPRALLRLNQHRHEGERHVALLLGVFVDDPPQRGRQLVGTVVINLKLRKKSRENLAAKSLRRRCWINLQSRHSRLRRSS